MQKSSEWEAPLNCPFKSANNEKMGEVQVNDSINKRQVCSANKFRFKRLLFF